MIDVTLRRALTAWQHAKVCENRDGVTIVRTILIAFAFAGTVSMALPAVAAGPDVEALAKELAAKPKPGADTSATCPKKLPDGTCPDLVETRQMRLGGAPAGSVGTTTASMARRATAAIRSDISMTFLKGSADLTASAKATLDRFAKALVAAGSYRPFTVEGHTDRSGSREVNQALSQARAESVVKYLASNGVDAGRMTAKGYGFDRPLKGVSPDQPANRRVEVSAF